MQRQGSSGSQPLPGLSLLLLGGLSETPIMCQVKKPTPILRGQVPVQDPESNSTSADENSERECENCGSDGREGLPRLPATQCLEQELRKPWGTGN